MHNQGIQDKYPEYYLKAKHWLDNHKSFHEIREKLDVEGCDEIAREQIIAEIRKIHYASKRKRGSMIILAGCVLLLIGFVLTVLNFHDNKSFTYVMYGFTSAGLLIIFAGLYDCFG